MNIPKKSKCLKETDDFLILQTGNHKSFKKNKTPLKIRLKIFFSPCRWCRKIKKIDARVCCPRCKFSE